MLDEHRISRRAYVIYIFFLIWFFLKINKFFDDHDDILGGVNVSIPIDSSFLAKLKPVIVSLYLFRLCPECVSEAVEQIQRTLNSTASSCTRPQYYRISLISLYGISYDYRLRNEQTVGCTFFPQLILSCTCCRNTPKFFRTTSPMHSNLTEIWPTIRVFDFPFSDFSVTQHFHQFWFGVHNLWVCICFIRYNRMYISMKWSRFRHTFDRRVNIFRSVSQISRLCQINRSAHALCLNLANFTTKFSSKPVFLDMEQHAPS